MEVRDAGLQDELQGKISNRKLSSILAKKTDQQGQIWDGNS